MKQRVVTALLLAPLAIAIILLVPTPAFAVVIAGLCLLALWEWTRLSGLRDRRVRAVLLALATVGFYELWVNRDAMAAIIAVAAGCAWWVVALAWLKHFSFAAAPTRENALLKLVAGALCVFPAWIALMRIHAAPAHGNWWALYALLLGWSADTFAYLAGMRWGQRKLAPAISPGKTWAGVYGGLAATAVVAAIGGWLLGVRDLELFALVVLAMLCVCFSVVGDLFESLIKRHAGVKDSGALFPGHGGVFDRLDGLFALLPLFALGKLLLGL
ncbi:MAG TPA: phosphatidate cytidylyltransferase [Rudaea sp.]|nr:phosphatidate cytidylyltransferase [Rudaea sp.]